MKRLLTTIAVVVVMTMTAGCTPDQIARWRAWFDTDPVAAVSYADSLPDPPATDCSEWYWYAIEAGFTPEQWISPVSWIMFRESRCDPNADNPSSSAEGLMQILAGTWADDCGGTPADLYDPMFNLRCAYHVWLVSGWSAWSTY